MIMPRSIWSGVISFGVVSIPVKLYPATQTKDVSFNLLHKTCGTRLKQLRWCPYHEASVEWEEVARGYEYNKDQYIVLTDEDFEKLPLPSKRVIELSAFVHSDEIDPVYYEKSYYLEPAQEAVKPFALLLRVLEEKRLVGIAKIAIRSKEHLCALRPRDSNLMLETLFYSDEIRVERAELGDIKVTDREMEMAATLVEVLTEPFKPEEYQDEYRVAVMQLIEAKREGREIVEAPVPVGAGVIDLMSALRDSVEAARKRREERSAREERRGAA
jgi:DNA end-binding protein Ku